MAELKFGDLLVLNQSDRKRQVLNMATLSDVSSLSRIVEAGLSDDQGKLTTKGVKAVEMVESIIRQFAAGVPLSKRKYNEAKEVERPMVGAMSWSTGEYQKKPYFTNSELIMMGRTTKVMRASSGLSSTRKSVADTITSIVAGKPSEFVELTFFLFQLDVKTGTQYIWMSSKDGKLVVPIQAMYFDFVRERYPSCTFHTNVKKPTQYPSVQVRVTNRGWKNNVVALIMSLDTEGMQIPSFDQFE
jgi:hypothetical protein